MKLHILKGCHYSTFLPRLYKHKNCKHSVSITFNNSCLYEIEEKSCVNKLWGFAYGFGVHKNSIRFGWTSEEGKIQIWSYIYANGKLNKERLIQCQLNTMYKFGIEFKETDIYLSINDKLIKTTSLKQNPKFLTELGFYFGGKTRAPHKMWIDFNYESKN